MGKASMVLKKQYFHLYNVGFLFMISVGFL
jgi:hypothetical protein